jgi:hypothetical protein
MVLVATWAYRAVVLSLAWPSSTWITRTSVLASKRCVAKLCRRCCQTNANSSQFTSKANLLGHEETAPLSESSGTVQLEIGAGREAAFLIEMVEDRGMNRRERL